MDFLHFGHLFCQKWHLFSQFWEFKIKVYIEVDAIGVSIWILRCIGWTGLLRWFSWGSSLLEFWIWLDAVGLAVLSGLGCRETCLPEGRLHLPWSLTSNNCRAPGRMLDTLLPTPLWLKASWAGNDKLCWSCLRQFLNQHESAASRFYAEVLATHVLLEVRASDIQQKQISDRGQRARQSTDRNQAPASSASPQHFMCLSSSLTSFWLTPQISRAPTRVMELALEKHFQYWLHRPQKEPTRPHLKGHYRQGATVLDRATDLEQAIAHQITQQRYSATVAAIGLRGTRSHVRRRHHLPKLSVPRATEGLSEVLVSGPKSCHPP
jgi:hypothetical protein